nr:hypothetical protein [Nanoarchaeum sp.]
MSLDAKVETYIITSAQGNVGVNRNFLEGLKKCCEFYNGEILVQPMRGLNNDDEELVLKSILSGYHIVSKDQKLNDKIRVSNYEILPQQIIPLTGLERFTQSDVSTIFASPKQFLRVVPNSNRDLPKVLMSTGAVTLPRYNQNRIGLIAERDHTFGAILVQVKGKTKYHYRQLSALKNGEFFDLGMRFSGTETPLFVRPEAMILGDWHCGDTDPDVRAETFEMIQRYKPKVVVIHDFFNGYSINHHDKNDKVKLAQNRDKLSLEDELRLAAEELEKIVEVCDGNTGIYLVKSNHDEWLEKYLSNGEFISDSQNAVLGAELFIENVRGNDPLVEGIRKYYKFPSNVTFLSRDDDLKILGWQLGSHGDLGANGGKPGIRTIEKAHGRSITGHSHTPQIFRNAWVVGTSTYLKLDYNEGLSSWLNTHGFLYSNRKPQLVNIVEGTHRF